jgi:hypothetical protein
MTMPSDERAGRRDITDFRFRNDWCQARYDSSATPRSIPAGKRQFNQRLVGQPAGASRSTRSRISQR